VQALRRPEQFTLETVRDHHVTTDANGVHGNSLQVS
jgi:hypothetical protein